MDTKIVIKDVLDYDSEEEDVNEPIQPIKTKNQYNREQLKKKLAAKRNQRRGGTMPTSNIQQDITAMMKNPEFAKQFNRMAKQNGLDNNIMQSAEFKEALQLLGKK